MQKNNKKPRRVTSRRKDVSQPVSQIVSHHDPLSRVRTARSLAELVAAFPASLELFGEGLQADRMGRHAGARHALRVADGCASTVEIKPPPRPRVLWGMPITPDGTVDGAAGRWSAASVFDRVMEAVDTLGRIPMQVRPKAFGNSMPVVDGGKWSLSAEVELINLGILEQRREELNEVRLPPSTKSISRMDEATGWILDYLADRPELAQAVWLAALFEVNDINPRRTLRRRGLKRRELYQRSVKGLELLADALNRASSRGRV